jgi:hypothetical protein
MDNQGEGRLKANALAACLPGCLRGSPLAAIAAGVMGDGQSRRYMHVAAAGCIMGADEVLRMRRKWIRTDNAKQQQAAVKTSKESPGLLSMHAQSFVQAQYNHF